MSEELNKENEQGQAESPETEDKITMTKAELDALLQKEGDRRVTGAMKTIERKQREANKLKNMTDAEKFEYELSQREAELEERENKLILAENKATCVSILVDKGLDASLVDFVVDVDADSMNDKIKRLEKAFKASVKKEVESRLAGSAPKKNLVQSDALTKKDLLKMSLGELQQFKLQNPQTYSELMK